MLQSSTTTEVDEIVDQTAHANKSERRYQIQCRCCGHTRWVTYFAMKSREARDHMPRCIKCKWPGGRKPLQPVSIGDVVHGHRIDSLRAFDGRYVLRCTGCGNQRHMSERTIKQVRQPSEAGRMRCKRCVSH